MELNGSSHVSNQISWKIINTISNMAKNSLTTLTEINFKTKSTQNYQIWVSCCWSQPVFELPGHSLCVAYSEYSSKDKTSAVNQSFRKRSTKHTIWYFILFLLLVVKLINSNGQTWRMTVATYLFSHKNDFSLWSDGPRKIALFC